MTTKDFLTNHIFIKWVNHPDRGLDAYWKNWMADNPGHLPELKLARELLLRTRYREFEPRPGAKQRILDNILNSPAPAADRAARRNTPHALFPTSIWNKAGQFMRIAAILLVSCLLGWLAFPDKQPVSSPMLSQEIPTLQKRAAAGEKLQVTLSDGTRVWLNSVSEMSFPEYFGTIERVVHLSGEAFFEVQEDSLRPFRVVANGTVTTALGTSFNVNAKSVGGVKVSLLTGKVKVKATPVSEDVFLDPGQELLFNREQEKITIKGFNSREVAGWKEGLILFSQASLPEVVKVLEDWYGVKIHLQNAESLDWEYSAEYKNQTLDNVLNSLSYIQKFKYTIREKNVEFKF